MHAPTVLALAALAALPAIAQQTAPASTEGDTGAPSAGQAGSTTPGAGTAATTEQDAGTGAVTETATAPGTEAPAAGPLEFRTIVGDKPIEIATDKVTEAFEQFRETGTNPFTGDEEAIAEGQKIYARLCQACHLPQGEGRIGPSLRDENWRNPRLQTEAGRFEIIHSGGAGAMQAFHRRMDFDEILKVMAYIDTFRGG